MEIPAQIIEQPAGGPQPIGADQDPSRLASFMSLVQNKAAILGASTVAAFGVPAVSAVASPDRPSPQPIPGQIDPSADPIFGDLVPQASASAFTSTKPGSKVKYQYYKMNNPKIEKKLTNLQEKCPDYLSATNEHWNPRKAKLGQLTLHRAKKFGDHQSWTLNAKKKPCLSYAITYDGKIFFLNLVNGKKITDPKGFGPLGDSNHAVASMTVPFSR